MYKSKLIRAGLTAMLMLTATMVTANPIEQRQEIMEDMKDAMGVVGGMLKGKVEFNADDAHVALQRMRDGAEHFGELFPEGSEQGHDTEARPEIWSDREGFEQALNLFRTSLDTALATTPGDFEAYKELATPVVRGCKNCHDDYRVDRD